MKKYIRYILYELVVVSTKLYSYIYRFKNYNKKKILIYTDSRGFEITKIFNRKNPFSSYVGFFIKNYNVTFKICPEKHTTILDFLKFLNTNEDNYDRIILHAGVVDFSPRPLSSAKKMYRDKENFIYSFFAKEEVTEHLNNFYDIKYEDEYTVSFYSLDMARKIVVPELKKIKNLIWISCNPVLNKWKGNYFKDRPPNMNIIMEYNDLFLKNLNNVIDITRWNELEIKEYTCDNIHMTKKGFKYIRKNISNLI